MSDKESVGQLADFLQGLTRGVERDAILTFASEWSNGNRNASDLARKANISRPTAGRWRDEIVQNYSPTVVLRANRITKEKLIEHLDSRIEATAAEGRDQDLARLTAEKARLEGLYEPDKTVSEVYSVQATIAAGGPTALLESIQETLAKLPPNVAEAMGVKMGISGPNPRGIGKNARRREMLSKPLSQDLEVAQTGSEGHIGGHSHTDQDQDEAKVSDSSKER